MWLGLFLACAAPEDPRVARILTLSPVPAPPPDPTNRYADDPAAARFGEQLFADVGLSGSGTVACVTCHDPARGFTDGKPVATAVGTGTRNTPSVVTAGYQTWYFWDGRADSAWAQATGPIRNPIEMNGSAHLVHDRIRDRWASEYTAVFGPVPDDDDTVLVDVGKALEAYERTLRPPTGKLDAYVADLAAGRTPTALSDAEERGLYLFVGRAACFSCHHGPLLTDHTFHTLGLPGAADEGRAKGAFTVLADPFNCRSRFSDAPAPCDELHYLDPAFPDWAGAFKTPSLRGLSQTAPYMHDGSMPTIEAVLAFYTALPGQPLQGHRELTLQPLQMSAEQLSDLAAFLHVL